jgi:NAD(P)H dehydrogenase (quinone)
MQHLVIVCHPKRQSFTQTMARAYVRELKALGHDVAVRDLYRLRFDPVLSDRELLGTKPPIVPAAVKREQRHIAAAGGIAFFYPLWWAFMPAMLKGYFDRALSQGFAYDLKDEEMLPRLTGKKALIFTSSGADMDYLRQSGQWEAMRTLEKDHMLGLAGIKLLDHVHFPSIMPGLSTRELGRHLERMKQAVQRHWGDAPAARG